MALAACARACSRASAAYVGCLAKASSPRAFLAPAAASCSWRRWSSQGTGNAILGTPAERAIDSPPMSQSTMTEVADSVNNLLYNTPMVKEPKERHVLSALVENESGVLAKISGLLAARGFNIDSLVVSATQMPKLSRMTIVLRGQESQILQAQRQLVDIVHIWGVLDYTNTRILERELCLVKVSTNPKGLSPSTSEELLDANHLRNMHRHRHALTELTKLFEGRIVDIGTDQMILELVTWSSRVDAFIRMVEPYGIIEASRSGVMAMARSRVEGVVNRDELEEAPVMELSDLPPS